MLYIFAAFLILTGIKMFFAGDQPMDVANNPAARFISTHMPVTRELHSQKFFVRTPDPETGKMVTAATPLFLVLVVINLADLVFAVDSVPAICAMVRIGQGSSVDGIFLVEPDQNLHIRHSTIRSRAADAGRNIT